MAGVHRHLCYVQDSIIPVGPFQLRMFRCSVILWIQSFLSGQDGAMAVDVPSSLPRND